MHEQRDGQNRHRDEMSVCPKMLHFNTTYLKAVQNWFNSISFLASYNDLIALNHMKR